MGSPFVKWDVYHCATYSPDRSWQTLTDHVIPRLLPIAAYPARLAAKRATEATPNLSIYPEKPADLACAAETQHVTYLTIFINVEAAVREMCVTRMCDCPTLFPAKPSRGRIILDGANRSSIAQRFSRWEKFLFLSYDYRDNRWRRNPVDSRVAASLGIIQIYRIIKPVLENRRRIIGFDPTRVLRAPAHSLRPWRIIMPGVINAFTSVTTHFQVERIVSRYSRITTQNCVWQSRGCNCNFDARERFGINLQKKKANNRLHNIKLIDERSFWAPRSLVERYHWL